MQKTKPMPTLFKPSILVIGPIPPPFHGVTVSTRLILESPAFQEFRLLHLDTSDRRSIANIGKFEIGNIFLGLRHAWKYLAMLLHDRPDLVYVPISQGTGGFLRDLTFLLPARWLGVRVVVHLRGSEFRVFYQETSGLMRLLIRTSLASVRRAIVLGESLRGVFAGLVPEERIAVVPNGSEDFLAGAPSPERPAGEFLTGLYLSNLRRRKGVLVALDAAISAMQSDPNLYFIFAGEYRFEELRTRIEARLRDSGLVERLLLPGVVTGTAKQRLLLESDFLLFPPIEPEGHPRVILEAMAAGLPVITTAQGAIPETVLDGVTGFIVPPGDAGAILEKIQLLTRNPEIRLRMGRAARQRFLELYTAEKSNARLAQVFKDVLEEA
jgi:glycosyltransferase involved in cell wall biosynthesis